MATSVTIGGGGATSGPSVKFAFPLAPSAELQAAVAALDKFVGSQSVSVLNSTSAPLGSGVNILNVSPNAGDTISATSGEPVVLYGNNAATLNGAPGPGMFLAGNEGNDTINAMGGSGSIFAGDGANLIELNSPGYAGGSDTITTGLGLTGSDTIRMWGGSASIVSGSAGGSSIPEVDVYKGSNTVTGSADGGPINVNLVGWNVYQNDTINLNTSGSTVKIENSQAAGDTISATVNFAPNVAGVVSVGGSGVDQVTINGGASDVVNVTGGQNTISGTAGTFELAGGTNSVSVVGSSTVVIGGGSNTVNLSGGSQTVVQVADNPVDALGNPTDLLSMSGNDTLTASGDNYITHFGVGNDSMSLAGNDTLSLGVGNDTVSELGSATIYGGTGNEMVGFGSGAGVFNGVAGGHATILGGSGADTVTFNGGVNEFVGGSGSVYLSMNSGTNLFDAGSGGGTINLGGGTNTFDFTEGVAHGHYTISGFTALDQINLQGYGVTLNSLLNGTAPPSDYISVAANGNTVISLDNGATTITLVSFNASQLNTLLTSNHISST